MTFTSLEILIQGMITILSQFEQIMLPSLVTVDRKKDSLESGRGRRWDSELGEGVESKVEEG